jgi:hypothetical protein
MSNLISENTQQPLAGSKPKRKPNPHGEMDYSEEGRKRNLILRNSRIWINLDPSIPCVANGKRKGVAGKHACAPESLEERIAFYFQHIQVNEKSCWIWTKNNSCDGYGRLKFLGKSWKINRFAWLANFGNPGTFQVCHTCDVKLCSNPNHLFLGTAKNNLDNMRLKMRAHRVYDPKKILQVHQLRKEGLLYSEIETITGIPKNHVGKIIRGELWSYLTEELVMQPCKHLGTSEIIS